MMRQVENAATLGEPEEEEEEEEEDDYTRAALAVLREVFFAWQDGALAENVSSLLCRAFSPACSIYKFLP